MSYTTTPSDTPSDGENFKPNYRELTAPELDHIASATLHGCHLCLRYLGDEAVLSPELLDNTYQAWVNDTRRRKPSGDAVADGLGALLGKFLVDTGDGRWVVLEDAWGADFAVVHPDGWRVCPIDFVSKRVDEGVTRAGFFQGLLNVLKGYKPA